MGSGNWSANTYSTNTGSKISSGRTFGYSNTTKSQSRNTWKAHESLDPKKKAGSASPLAGQIVREARDNDEHPNSVPISVFFDETGSMGTIPRVVQEKLGGLFTLLLRKGYVEDPQLLIGAYGDAYTDSVPLQVGQSESDNRVDETLDNLFLEGYGEEMVEKQPPLPGTTLPTTQQLMLWRREERRDTLSSSETKLL